MTLSANTPRPPDYDRELCELEMLQGRLEELADWLKDKMRNTTPTAREALDIAWDHTCNALVDCNYLIASVKDDAENGR